MQLGRCPDAGVGAPWFSSFAHSGANYLRICVPAGNQMELKEVEGRYAIATPLPCLSSGLPHAVENGAPALQTPFCRNPRWGRTEVHS
jgi:hypothetical protein